MSTAQRIDRLWWAMLAATAASWWIGETGLWTGPLWPLLTVFGLSLFKGLAIALDFMELRGAPAVWRRFVVGWLLLVILAVVALHLGSR